jgi:hypothetical protein
MDDAPEMRECFFVVLIPFVLWFLVFDTATAASSLFFLVVVHLFDYTPPPDTFISSLRADSKASTRAFVVDIQSA